MTKLKPFQLAGARQIRAFKGRALLADEMGLGKTIQSLYWILKTPRRRPVVIVVPASVKYTWQSEAAIHFNMRTEVLEGQMKRRQPLPGSVVIINYDILESWLPVLLKAKPQTVIFDEAHHFNFRREGPSAREGQKMMTRAIKVAAKAKNRFLLTATPIFNSPGEAAGIYAMLLGRPGDDNLTHLTAYANCFDKAASNVENVAPIVGDRHLLRFGGSL